jgi:putative membrane protein insertion efficiency factor
MKNQRVGLAIWILGLMRLCAVLHAANRLPRLFGRGMVKGYRYTLSPLVGFHCRHLPTCSEYADEAIERHGLWAGSWMILARLARCHPWGSAGLDLVPGSLPDTARWFLPWRYGIWRGVNSPADHLDRDAKPATRPEVGQGS